MSYIDKIPLEALFVITIVVVLIAIEAGYRFARFLKARTKDDQEAPVATMVQATLSLVAFMIAFTFGVAAQRFNERRVLIIQEASSISSTFSCAELLPEANKNEVQNCLRKYLDLRVKEQPYSKNGPVMIAESEKLQKLPSSQAVEVSKANINSGVISSFLSSLNETMSFQSKRVAAGLYARIPEHIWTALYLIILLGMAAAGYQTGKTGSKSITVNLILTFSFAIVMTLIADLDHPSIGFVEATRMPLIDLQRKIGCPAADIK